MRRTLYRKLILIYVILAIAGFTLISTVGSRMVEDSLVSSASTSLYREATQIASKQWVCPIYGFEKMFLFL